MEESANIQKRLFKQIKEQWPEHLSLVDELSQLLQISTDSVYRRIRGEKHLSLAEVELLGRRFNISIDSFIQNPANTLPFHYVSVDEEIFTIEDYLNNLFAQARSLRQHRDAEIILIANDLTIFQLLQLPELAAFKLFFWLKSALGFSTYSSMQFSIDSIDESIITLSRNIVKEYVGIKSIEVVGIDAVNSFLRQIHYYYELGFFKDRKDAILICEKLHELVQHFHQEADLGFKFQHGQKAAGRAGNFTMYYNELFVIDGVLLSKMGEKCRTYIATGPLNYLTTTDAFFFENKIEWAKNLMRRSILLSGLSEKERNRYFLQTLGKIEKFKNSLS